MGPHMVDAFSMNKLEEGIGTSKVYMFIEDDVLKTEAYIVLSVPFKQK